MKKLMTLTLGVVSLGVLSACDSVGDGYIDTQPPYSEERTAASVQTPPPTEQVVVREEQPVITQPAPAPAPMRPAEPVFEQRVMK